MEQTDASVLITNLEGEIEFINPAFTRNTGYSAAEAIGKTPRLLQSGRHPKEFYQKLWAILGRGEVWRGTFINRITSYNVCYTKLLRMEKGKINPVNGGKMIYLDVTDRQSIKDAVALIKNNENKLDALVNNAGYGIAGSVEDTSYEEMFSQFNTNFFGALQVINESIDRNNFV